MTIGEIISLIAAAIAALALTLNYSKARRTDVLDGQAIRDKLDYISDTTRDTREDVRALDRKLDDHASRISKIEVRVDDCVKRLDRVEDKIQ